MRAIGYSSAGEITRPDALIERDIPEPRAAGRDLLVRVAAVSVNPVDAKVRRSTPPSDGFRVLGFDAVGTVEAVGDEVTLFAPGDRVWYAGSIGRPGSNAQLQLVDERIVSHAPVSLTDAQAAAMPLTSITAWEMLFDRLDVRRPVRGGGNAILIVGGAGGVGSIAIQLAKAVAGLSVIATASRPETAAWAKAMGADAVIDHSRPLAPQIRELGVAPGFVFSTTETEQHFDDIVELIAPQGRLGVISGIGRADVNRLSGKSVALCFELMFTRSNHQTPDMIEQHRLLAEIARRTDEGQLKTTLGEHFGRLTADNLRRAHARIETGAACGKIVLEGL
ncbi:MAG TPA: zinc-binding alcohol dehydrogenase family protein [Devosia sp.]|nr:zinc-binding alcohol dehydrogenase family protein [Devosia sp.]